MSEDYAPFNIDVTTEQPTRWTSTTGHALITPEIDAHGIHCPHFGYGGYAYISPGFGNVNYSYNTSGCYSPAFVLPLGDTSASYSSTAEAISHELGHNMGLSHDGTTLPDGAYYWGHGSGDISWAPIMGAGYGKNVTQWSKGEYYLANNPEDDLAIISAKVPYRTDDHGNTNSVATLLTASNETIISSGIITSNTDVDVLAFFAGIGSMSLTVFPYRCANSSYGGNLDINARLYNSLGALVASNNPSDTTQAVINYASPAAGKFYLFISNSGAGNPTNSSPSGYTSYGSIGQYFVTGTVAQASGIFVKIPNGGELWYKGQTNTIRWTSGTNAVGNVKVELFRGEGRYSTIANNLTNTGTYSWNITNPMLSSTNFKVHISSLTQTGVWDRSDGPFSITVVPPTTNLFENFDASPSLPVNWSQTNLACTNNWKFQPGGWTGYWYPSSAHSGSYNACLYDETTDSDICILSTPILNASGCTGAVLRFWHCMTSWESDQDFLNILIKTNEAGSWVWIAGYSNSVASWTQRTIALPNPGTNYTIGFAGNAKYGYGVCLDDVEVIGYPEDINYVTNNTPLSWLVDNSLDPTDAAALSDTDSDGMKAWEEWIAGTCPTQSSSVLNVSNTWNAVNAPIIIWSAVTGRTYSVNWATNLLTTPFAPMTNNITTGVYTDTVHTVEQTGFYRIGVQVAP